MSLLTLNFLEVVMYVCPMLELWFISVVVVAGQGLVQHLQMKVLI